MIKKVSLTGDRPTGRMHIGHLLGSLNLRVKMQEEYDQYIMIANAQALTDNFDNPAKVKESTKELLKDYYSVGIDFSLNHIFLQSEVNEVHEIAFYLANFTTLQQLLQNPTLKTEISQKNFEKSTPLGFFYYPHHQCGDILAVGANFVPVGKDQAPMVEHARDVARKFNTTYGVEALVEPQALFGVEKNIPGLDGNAKMGKSLNNAIYLSDDEETLRKKVFAVYTDPTRIRKTDKGHIEGNVAFLYHDFFNENIEEVKDLKERYVEGLVGDVEVKEKLFLAMNKKLVEIREKRFEAEKKIDMLFDMMLEHSKATKNKAKSTVDKMKVAMRIDV
jgi:tryptophanyl-tRNA synthetase